MLSTTVLANSLTDLKTRSKWSNLNEQTDSVFQDFITVLCRFLRHANYDLKLRSQYNRQKQSSSNTTCKNTYQSLATQSTLALAHPQTTAVPRFCVSIPRRQHTFADAVQPRQPQKGAPTSCGEADSGVRTAAAPAS